jgi:hypothetical protein
MRNIHPHLGFFEGLGLGFDLRDFLIAKQVLYSLNHTSSLFCLVILEMGVSQTSFLGWL